MWSGGGVSPLVDVGVRNVIFDLGGVLLDWNPDKILQSFDVLLYGLSDMPVSIYTHVRLRHDFWKLFRGIVISGEVKMMKPEPEVFKYLLARFGLEPGQTVFVDDFPLNIDAARAVGLRAIQFCDAAQCERDLNELLAA